MFAFYRQSIGNYRNRRLVLLCISNALVDVLPPEADSSISMLQPDEKPEISYADIGGMDMQKQEIREAVELPLTHFELYKQIGIDPPRGVLMVNTLQTRHIIEKKRRFLLMFPFLLIFSTDHLAVVKPC